MLHCHDCGWMGIAEDCEKTYEGLLDGSVEPMLLCPKCGGDRLAEINEDPAVLQPYLV